MLGGEARARLPRLLRGRLDQALGVRGVGQLLGAPSGPPASAGGLEPLPHAIEVETEPLEDRTAGALGLEQREHDMLGADRIVPQAHRFRTRRLEHLLGPSAQGSRVDARSGSFLGQRGFASSISMMGMPSSTG